MNKDEFEKTFSDKKSKQLLVFKVLSDKEWQCRNCKYIHVKTSQLAGSGGIQGLKRGGSNRPGLEIESENHLCGHCDKSTRHDKWTGNFIEPYSSASMPQSFIKKTFSILGKKDIVDNTTRNENHLTIDHKLPMIRWNTEEKKKQTDYENMTDEYIRSNFQLLKKSNGTISHNALKSRACENCWKNGVRGKPFGIDFFYRGSGKWGSKSKTDTKGCVGCGWYDLEKWRKDLNQMIRASKKAISSE